MAPRTVQRNEESLTVRLHGATSSARSHGRVKHKIYPGVWALQPFPEVRQLRRGDQNHVQLLHDDTSKFEILCGSF